MHYRQEIIELTTRRTQRLSIQSAHGRGESLNESGGPHAIDTWGRAAEPAVMAGPRRASPCTLPPGEETQEKRSTQPSHDSGTRPVSALRGRSRVRGRVMSGA